RPRRVRFRSAACIPCDHAAVSLTDTFLRRKTLKHFRILLFDSCSGKFQPETVARGGMESRRLGGGFDFTARPPVEIAIELQERGRDRRPGVLSGGPAGGFGAPADIHWIG